MTTIWKFTFKTSDSFTIDMPEESKIIHIEIQYGKPTLWAVVNTESPIKTKKFKLIGTGHPIELNNKLNYLKTFSESIFIWHLFEDLKEINYATRKGNNLSRV